VASDDRLVSHYLILDGESNPAGNTFVPVPGGPKQNPIITVNDFILNDADGSHTIYAWVKDDSGLVSATALKTRVILERSSNVVVGPSIIRVNERIQGSNGDGIQEIPNTRDGSDRVNVADTNPIPGQNRWTNHEPHLYRTAVNDRNPGQELREAIEVLEVIPVGDLGMAPEEKGVQQNTGFSVFIESASGIDMTAPNSVTFTIADGERTYTRRLNDLNGAGVKLMRAVPWDEEGNNAYCFWAVYYRSNETAMPNTYPSGSSIEVTVNAEDVLGITIEPVTFRFRIQSDGEKNIETANLPETSTTIDPSTSMKTTTITSGPLTGASILFSTTLLEEMGIEPYFGPLEDIPLLAGLEAAGMPLNLLPHTLFTSPVTLIIPCAEDEEATGMSVYYHDGRAWWLACDNEGNITPNGEGWMVPGSRVNHEGDNQRPDYIEIQVYHFSAAAAASPPAAYASGGSGGACFISSLWK
jgi:hypothetical protein